MIREEERLRQTFIRNPSAGLISVSSRTSALWTEPRRPSVWRRRGPLLEGLRRLWPGDAAGQHRNHPREDVSLEEHDDADQRRERDAVPEDIAQDLPFVPLLARGDPRDDDALGIDHLSHHTAAAVGGAGQDGIQPQLLGAHPLEVAEKD